MNIAQQCISNLSKVKTWRIWYTIEIKNIAGTTIRFIITNISLQPTARTSYNIGELITINYAANIEGKVYQINLVQESTINMVKFDTPMLDTLDI